MEARMLTEASGKFAYQKMGEEYVADRESAPLQWGFSTGKSRVAFTRCVRDARIDYILVFCRKDNVDTLRKELVKHTNLSYSELTGTTAAARKIVQIFSRRLRSQRTKHVFLMGHDRAKSLEEDLTALEPTAVIVDECTAIKAWSAERTKAICRIGHLPSVLFRCPMAGEFAPQEKVDFWSIFYFADKGRTLGDSFFHFQRTYFVKMGYDLIMKPGARETLMDLVSKNCHTLPTKDARIPKRVQYRCISVKASDEQDQWLAMFGKGIMKRPDGAVFALKNGGVSFEKQLQVTGGYFKWMDVYGPSGEIVEEGIVNRLEQNPKLDRLIALLKEEMPERLVAGNPKFVIWARHSEEIVMIQERLTLEGIKCVRLSGSLNNNRENTMAKAMFFSDQETRGFIAQSDMGYGLNELVVADTSIWFSNSHRVEARMQAEWRFDRPDQEAGIINHIDLVLEGKEDAVVAFAVAEARIDVQGFTNAVKLLQAAAAAKAARGETPTSDYQTLQYDVA